MNTVELAYSRLPEVLEMFGLPSVSKRHIKECPICGKKDKFRLDNYKGEGNWVCTCGSGNLFKLIELVHNLSFKDIAKQIDDAFNYKPTIQTKKKDNNLERCMARVKSASKVKGTNVEEYLRSRGIYEVPKRGVFCSNGNMLSVAVDPYGNPAYQHETFLDGNKKANVKVQKKMLSLSNSTPESYCVRLYDSASTLGISEGIETALSARQIYKCNVWSTLNAGGMEKFKAPPGVKHLIIFADNDKNGAGLAAATRCGHLAVRQSKDIEKVSIRWPSDVCDFNDMLINGSGVFEINFYS